MANKKFAIKKARRDDRVGAENKKTKKNLKKLLKKASSKKDIASIHKALDKAAKRRIIHPNKASRLKSRLAKKLDAQKKAS